MNDFQLANPTTKFHIHSPNGLFQHIMILMPHSAEVFAHAYKVIGVDSATMNAVDFSKLPRDVIELLPTQFDVGDRLISKTKLTCASTRTLNNEMFSIGYMISYTEKEEELSSFIEFLIDNGVNLNSPDIIVLSDRALAIKSALQLNAPVCLHMLCPLHLERNLNTHKFVSPAQKSLYWKARNAPNLGQFLSVMEQIKTNHLKM